METENRCVRTADETSAVASAGNGIPLLLGDGVFASPSDTINAAFDGGYARRGVSKPVRLCTLRAREDS